ncbi:MAG: ABC transporter permease [Armatimonadota bacterium]|nr:ABC transporter permease [Armatimonadota bacterium]MDR7454840.1 ABC transporter permease [Armatimonadota bacterium]MDR7457781.1 ABC transporter permease [Armatimonadota bacterium]MDR7498004.1 ABC transporter permease [Armatimonadota bacterium]MDR7512762.1 ABC transporter permease [Armatimonadota bacterium]
MPAPSPPMARYLSRRLLQTAALLLVVSVVVFALILRAPGGPSILLDRNLGADEIARMRTILGLDQPLHVQYARWLRQVAGGNLGVSYTAGLPVREIIGQMLPNTLVLSAAALLLSLVVAIPAGVATAARPYTAFDHAVTFLCFFGVSIPVFWYGLMLIVLFSIVLGWLPPGGMYTIGGPRDLADLGRHLVLPALVLGTANMAIFARYTRSSTMAVLRQDYVRTARSKGLRERAVLYRHAFRNALLTIITVVGLQLPRLVGGAAITETVFAWPGMGSLAVRAAFERDYPMIMGITLVISAVVAASNLLVDLVYVYVDPRIRYE